MTKIWQPGKILPLLRGRGVDPRRVTLFPLGLAVVGLAIGFGVGPSLAATAHSVAHGS